MSGKIHDKKDVTFEKGDMKGPGPATCYPWALP